MWFAHHFPGLGLTPERLGRLTPEQTRALIDAGKPLLESESKDRVEHTKAIMSASGAKVF